MGEAALSMLIGIATPIVVLPLAIRGGRKNKDWLVAVFAILLAPAPLAVGFFVARAISAGLNLQWAP
jgi:hypothetical protein